MCQCVRLFVDSVVLLLLFVLFFNLILLFLVVCFPNTDFFLHTRDTERTCVRSLFDENRQNCPINSLNKTIWLNKLILVI